MPSELSYVDPWLAVIDDRFALAFTLDWYPYKAGQLLMLPETLDGELACSERLWEDLSIGQCGSVRSGPAGLSGLGGSVALPYIFTAGCAGQTPLEFGSGMTLAPQGSSVQWPGIPDRLPADGPESLYGRLASRIAIGGDGTRALAVGMSLNLYPGILVTEDDAALVDLSALVPDWQASASVPGPDAIAITTLGANFTGDCVLPSPFFLST